MRRAELILRLVPCWFALVLFSIALRARSSESGKLTLPPSVEEYVQRFEASYRNVRTLRAEFEQTYRTGGRTRVESGTVYFARGGRMRWEYHRPQEKLFLSDGKTLLLYIPEENQITRSSLKASEDLRVPFRLLLSRLNLHRVFSRLEFADGEPTRDPDVRILRVYPKREWVGDYREVRMEVNSEFDIRRLWVVYADQSIMEFTFDHLVRNVTLPPSLFKLAPPPGTEIIDE